MCVYALSLTWSKQKLFACEIAGGEREKDCFGLMLCKVGDIAIPLYLKYANPVQVRLKLFTKKLSRALGPRSLPLFGRARASWRGNPKERTPYGLMWLRLTPARVGMV